MRVCDRAMPTPDANRHGGVDGRQRAESTFNDQSKRGAKGQGRAKGHGRAKGQGRVKRERAGFLICVLDERRGPELRGNERTGHPAVAVAKVPRRGLRGPGVVFRDELAPDVEPLPSELEVPAVGLGDESHMMARRMRRGVRVATIFRNLVERGPNVR